MGATMICPSALVKMAGAVGIAAIAFNAATDGLDKAVKRYEDYSPAIAQAQAGVVAGFPLGRWYPELEGSLVLCVTELAEPVKRPPSTRWPIRRPSATCRRTISCTAS